MQLYSNSKRLFEYGIRNEKKRRAEKSFGRYKVLMLLVWKQFQYILEQVSNIQGETTGGPAASGTYTGRSSKPRKRRSTCLSR